MVRSILLMSSMTLILLGCDKHDNPMEPLPKTMLKVIIENIATPKMFSGSGIFNTPTGASIPGPVGPGDSYEFRFDASSDSYLSLATMYVQSNDLFYSPNGDQL